MEKIKVLIADDHPLVRQGLIKILQLDPGIEVCGEAADGQDAVIRTLELNPDVVLMDLNMPSLSGLEASIQLRDRAPQVRIIALTVEDSQQRVIEVIRAGVQGYILKDARPDALASTIKAVYAGETVIHPRIAAMLFREIKPTPLARESWPTDRESELTPREVEILTCLAQGIHNRDIASHLFISEKTVKNHISSIFRKLQVEDRTQAVLSAIKLNLVNL